VKGHFVVMVLYGFASDPVQRWHRVNPV
jgi:hypothetical protein